MSEWQAQLGGQDGLFGFGPVAASIPGQLKSTQSLTKIPGALTTQTCLLVSSERLSSFSTTVNAPIAMARRSKQPGSNDNLPERNASLKPEAVCLVTRSPGCFAILVARRSAP
jgi:hypothetical protein